MAALKISRKYHPWRHQPDDLPTWGQIKTLTNSQPEMAQSPENLITMLCWPARPPLELEADSLERRSWLHNPGNVSLFPSFTLSWSTPDHQVPVR